MTHGQLRAYGTVEEIGRQVSQQRTIELTLVAADQVALAANAVRQAIEPGAEVIEVATESTVRFRSARSESELGDVLTRLIQEGIRVTQFREVQTDLEEAFMSFARPQAAVAATTTAVGGAIHA